MDAFSYRHSDRGVLRLALVGLDSSHADHFVRLINTEDRFTDTRIVAVVNDDIDRAEALGAAGGIDSVGSDLESVIGGVDAAFVGHRSGSRHREPAERLLAAGIPVFVDKPLASSVVDAEAIVATAARHSTPVASWSAMRFVSAIEQVAREVTDTGAVSTITVTGPAEPRSPYDGLFFYGVHLVEAALALCAALDVGTEDSAEPEVQMRDDGVVATWQWSAIQVRLHFVNPSRTSQASFAASVVAGERQVDREWTVGPDYLAPVVDRFLAVCRGTPAPSADDLVRPVRMIAAVERHVQPPTE